MLQQLEIKDYSKLKDIMSRCMYRCGTEKRTNIDYVQANMTFSKSQDKGDLWTDDPDDPTCFLNCSVIRLAIFNENICIINIMYVDDEKDKKALKKIKEMFQTAETWARHKGCQALYVSSWIYEGRKDVQAIWSKMGAEPQEILNVKKL